MTIYANPESRKIVIFGAGGHAVSVANVAKSAGFTISHFVDKNKSGGSLLGISIIGDVSELNNLSQYCCGIAVGDNAVRQEIFNGLSMQHPGIHFPALVHSSAIISYFSNIGDGTVAMPHAVVGPNSNVGRFCILNTQSSIDHDCSMADYSSLAPGAVTGGNVSVGIRSAISIGAIVKHGLNIGDDSVIGANSYLDRDIPPNTVAYGTPAKAIRSRKIGDAYLK